MNRNSIICISLLFLISCYFLNAQTVTTFISGQGLDGPDGFALDSQSNLYVANWGGSAGTTVFKITPAALVTTHATGLSAPDGLAFDQAGNLYISNYNTGIISKRTADGAVTDFASGLNHPSSLAFDKAGNLYVSNHGNANGTTVSKITPDGTVSTFASGFDAPLGLAFDQDENLYVSNYNSGVVNKVSKAGVVTVFASVSNSPRARLQYLVFGKSGSLYVPAYGQNKIYKITPAGSVSVFAGTGTRGGANGRVDSAQFDGPNSIAITAEGDMYVSEYNTNRIRKIAQADVVGIEEQGSVVPKGFRLEQNFPNPFNPSTKITYALNKSSVVSLKVYDILGNEIKSLFHGMKNGGVHEVNWDGRDTSGRPAPCGIYFYSLASAEGVLTKKAVLLK